MLSYLIYFIFINITLFLPGFVFVNKTKIFATKEENFIFSFIITIFFYSLISFVWYVFSLNLNSFRIFLIFTYFLSVFYFIKNKQYKKINLYKFYIFFIVFSLISLIYISLPLGGSNKYFPDPTPMQGRNYNVFNVKILNLAHTSANDNYIPFRQAQFIVNKLDINKNSFIKEWGVNFFYRTPLMGSIVAYYFLLTNEKVPHNYLWSIPKNNVTNIYQKYQIIVHILNSLFILTTYIFLKKIFKKKVALISIIFLIFNPFFLYNTFFSWPKSFVAYFILASWYLLLKKNQSLLSGIILGLSFYAHDLALLYFFGIITYLILNKYYFFLVKLLIVFLIMITPWYIISRYIYHQSSLFYFYPFSLHGIPLNPKQAMREFFSTPLLHIFQIKADSLFYLLTPYNILLSNSSTLVHRLCIDSLFTIPGSIGFSLFIFSYANIIKRFIGKIKIITSFFIIPLVSSVMVIGWPINKYGGMGSFHFAQAIVILLIGFGTDMLLNLKNKFITYIVLVGLVLQYFVSFLYNFNFNIVSWYNNLRPVISLIIIFILYFYILRDFIKLKN